MRLSFFAVIILFVLLLEPGAVISECLKKAIGKNTTASQGTILRLHYIINRNGFNIVDEEKGNVAPAQFCIIAMVADGSEGCIGKLFNQIRNGQGIEPHNFCIGSIFGKILTGRIKVIGRHYFYPVKILFKSGFGLSPAYGGYYNTKDQ